MSRAIRNMAVAEVMLGVVVVAILVADRLGIGGPDSTSTAVLLLCWLAIAAAALACFVFYLPGSVRLLLSSPSERTVLRMFIVGLAACLAFALATWFILTFGRSSPPQ